MHDKRFSFKFKMKALIFFWTKKKQFAPIFYLQIRSLVLNVSVCVRCFPYSYTCFNTQMISCDVLWLELCPWFTTEINTIFRKKQQQKIKPKKKKLTKIQIFQSNNYIFSRVTLTLAPSQKNSFGFTFLVL